MARRRRRNNNNTNNNVSVDNNDIKVNPVDNVLEESKNTFQNVVVIGVLPNGTIDVRTTVAEYPFVHWMLNKAVFQLNIHENNALTNAKKETNDNE